jgi:hypothetical protein
MTDRTPGRDATGGLVTSAGRPPQPESPLRSQEGSVDCSVTPGRTLAYDQIDPARLVIGIGSGPACWYCGSRVRLLEPCCAVHPDTLACEDAAACARDLVELVQEAREAAP